MKKYVPIGNVIEIDAHGMLIPTVVKEIQMAITKNQNCRMIIVNHGYNHGRAIKNHLINVRNIHNNRVICTRPEPGNEGKTWIYVESLM